MKIVLLKDVPGLGVKDEAYEVKDGYARNFLLPRGAALVATKALLEKLQGKKKRNEARIKKEADEFRALAKKLEGVTFTLKADSGESGKLFGSVTNQDIAEAIKQGSGVEVDKRNILLEDPIKVVGETEVQVKLFRDIEAKVKIKVIPAS